jgi:nitrite reductase/ring-hydroxylating ferredoxin subunit
MALYTAAMSSFIKIGVKAEMPSNNEAREFPCGDKTLCIANVDGTLAALDNTCFHRGGPLGQGVVDSGKIVCPWHGWAYDPKTGAAAHKPDAKVAVYPLKVDGEDILVEI